MHAAASVSSCRGGTTHWRIIAASSALGIALGLGILVGRQSRLSTAPVCASRAEVALVIMTKDDWPLASRWLAWHGHVYGFEHLYVFDGSTGAQKDHLQDVTASYPIHLRHSLVDLNHIANDLARWIDEIKARYEWIIKVDTDEFVAHVAQGARAPDVTTSRLGLPPAVSDTLRTTVLGHVLLE